MLKILLIIVMLLSLTGCMRKVYMDQDAASRFGQFNASVQSWDRQCQSDPNTCAESLRTMAVELAVWDAIVRGIDPNDS